MSKRKKTKQNSPAPKVAKWYEGDGLDHPSVFLAKTLASYLVAGSKSGKLHFPFQIILLSLWAGTVKISQSPSSFLQLSSNSLIGVWLSEVHSSKKVFASMPWASLLKLAKPANPENHANGFFAKLKWKLQVKANNKNKWVKQSFCCSTTLDYFSSKLYV